MPTELLEQGKQEVLLQNDAENIRNQKVYVPRADIYESKTELVLFADMPGVKQDGVEIMLEQNILTIHGRVDVPELQGFRLAYSEYGIGDYKRVFALSNEIDRDAIEATIKNGVLKLVLPKSKAATPRKIQVKAHG